MKEEARVFAVLPDSIAMEADIEPGDIILSVNGHKIHDELDFRYYTAAEEFTVEVEKKNGDVEIIEIHNPDMEDMGIEFERALFSGAKYCSNKCIFCFIDQLPRGMRKSLYFKDDDSRLSFLTGNYVTLTNASDEDIEKIIRLRLDPINISVHTTNPKLRQMMLGNKKAGELLGHMQRLAKGGIHQNCQIVLVRGVNDKKELDYTLSDLAKLHPFVRSVSVVPVGITRYREGLYPLKPFDKEESIRVLEQVKNAQEQFLSQIGTRFVYAADEFYVKAGLDVPPWEEYEGFPQIENGVGMIRSFTDEFLDALDKNAPQKECRVTLVTGTAAEKMLCGLAEEARRRYPRVFIDVISVRNEFFGGEVSVCGLITGGDIVKGLKGNRPSGKVIIPDSMLRYGTDVFLDNMTVDGVSRMVGAKIVPALCEGHKLWEEIIS